MGATYTSGDVWLNPFLWNGKKLIDLVGASFAGPGNGEASWINEAGDVVGLAPLGRYCPPGSQVMQPKQRAFLWRKGVITDLGSLNGRPNSEADFVNARRQFVGISWDCNYNFSAFLW